MQFIPFDKLNSNEASWEDPWGDVLLLGVLLSSSPAIMAPPFTLLRSSIVATASQWLLSQNPTADIQQLCQDLTQCKAVMALSAIIHQNKAGHDRVMNQEDMPEWLALLSKDLLFVLQASAYVICQMQQHLLLVCCSRCAPCVQICVC